MKFLWDPLKVLNEMKGAIKKRRETPFTPKPPALKEQLHWQRVWWKQKNWLGSQRGKHQKQEGIQDYTGAEGAGLRKGTEVVLHIRKFCMLGG